MGNELHTMPLKIERLLSSANVQMLEADEFGVYIKLLCHTWLNKGVLPSICLSKPQATCRLLAIADLHYQRMIDHVVMVFFHQCDDGEWRNDTLTELYENALSISQKRALAGKKGGENRVKQMLGNSLAIAKQNSSIQSQSQNQSINSSDLEESKSSESNTYFSSDLEASNSEPEKVGLPPIVLVLDPIGFDGIEQSDIDGWTFAFPAVDLNREGVRAAIWCRDNGAKGKKKNYRRFLTNWFSRCQERGGSK